MKGIITNASTGIFYRANADDLSEVLEYVLTFGVKGNDDDIRLSFETKDALIGFRDSVDALLDWVFDWEELLNSTKGGAA